MGEYADQIINGECCAFCMTPFIDKKTIKDKTPTIYEHGYPVACKDCWEPGCGYQKADKEAKTL